MVDYECKLVYVKLFSLFFGYGSLQSIHVPGPQKNYCSFSMRYNFIKNIVMYSHCRNDVYQSDALVKTRQEN
ncbi:hypothetical protein PRUPE_1G176600 [Prunus persica]|uniref:Uncharacterized protein n=1 Tax=Prunus persica TaxID=3760 RepID=M5XFE2_PRUPE|nr:hypothetical protein PRUPE_1G176600 [Prunus persica]